MKKRDERRSVEGSRRPDLVRAAAHLMRKKGYAATTIRDIARAVGMASGSPFCHFRKKEGILAAIAAEGVERAVARAETLQTLDMDAKRRLRELLLSHAEWLHGTDGDFAVVLLREWRALAPESRRRLMGRIERYETIWRECLKEIVPDGHHAADPVIAARLMLGGLNWSMYWFRDDVGFGPRELADTAAALFLGLPGSAR